MARKHSMIHNSHQMFEFVKCLERSAFLPINFNELFVLKIPAKDFNFFRLFSVFNKFHVKCC